MINSRIIWDIDPEDFQELGSFAQLQRHLTQDSYSQLIAEEAKRVSHFLYEWENQLIKFQQRDFLTQSLSTLFLQTPQLSGVTYLSDNYVISEAFFNAEREGLGHLTDREVSLTIQKALPWSKQLSFSFPRKYSFFGFINSWGFIRFPRQNDQGLDAAVLISCTTLDPKVMKLMAETHFTHLVSLYNHVWDGAIHDYIHHIGLYTNPSFGIGKLSSMSIASVNDQIDLWGQSMMSTFNYEYWAHRSHRLITEKTLTDSQKEAITDKACHYVQEVYRFYDQLVSLNLSEKYIEEVVGYLLAIYLWPLGILLHPLSKWMEKIHFEINKSPFRKVISVLAIADLLAEKGQISDHSIKDKLMSNNPLHKMQGIQAFIDQATSGIDIGISYMLKGLGLENLNENSTLSWYEWLRVYTDITARRGLYESWYHQLPVIFNGKDIHPHHATLLILEHVTHALRLFEQKKMNHYQLSGIVAAWNG